MTSIRFFAVCIIAALIGVALPLSFDLDALTTPQAALCIAGLILLPLITNFKLSSLAITSAITAFACTYIVSVTQGFTMFSIVGLMIAGGVFLIDKIDQGLS